MDAAAWMKGFRLTHEKARQGQLVPDEQGRYLGMREELARSWLSSQGKDALPGKSARASFSVPQVYQVEISSLYKTMTREISCSRFVVTMSQDLKRNETVSYSLLLGRGKEPITGQATVVASERLGGASRITFELGKLSPEDAERLELALFDALLSRID